WIAAWVETTLDRIRRPSSTTAAAVSSQEVSIARIRTLDCSAPRARRAISAWCIVARHRGDCMAQSYGGPVDAGQAAERLSLPATLLMVFAGIAIMVQIAMPANTISSVAG